MQSDACVRYAEAMPQTYFVHAPKTAEDVVGNISLTDQVVSFHPATAASLVHGNKNILKCAQGWCSACPIGISHSIIRNTAQFAVNLLKKK